MRKIIAILLALTFIISLSACGKSTDKETTTQPPTTETPKIEITETTEKQNPKYNSEKLKTELVENLFNGMSGENAEDFKNVYEAINGRIVDIKAIDDLIYVLTPSALYEVHETMVFCQALQLDIANNTKIVTACENIIVLSDDKNNLTIYNDLLGEEGNSDYYEKCDIKELILESDDIFVGFAQSVAWDDAYIITDIKSSGITAKIFTQTNPYEADNKFDYYKTESFKFSKDLNGEIKKMIFSQDMDTSDGFILLDNGDLYYFEGIMCTYYSPRQFNIYGDAIKNAKNVWNSRVSDNIYVEKEDGKIYKIDFYQSDDKCGCAEEIINLPSELNTEDIETFLFLDDYYDTLFVVLNNDDIYSNINTENNKNTFVKHDVLSELNKDNKLINIVDIWGHTAVIADDGNMYELCR